VNPVLGREVVEGEQLRAVLGKALDGLGVLRAEGGGELIEGALRIGACLGHPDFVQRRFGLGLQRARGR